MAKSTWYVVVSNGVEKLRSQQVRFEADGSIRIKNGAKWMPIVIGQLCKEDGVDHLHVIEDAAPSKYLARLGMNAHGVEILTADEWEPRSRAESKARRQREAAALEAVAPGVAELKAAIEDHEQYAHEFEEMMEDEDNDGVRPPKLPTSDVAALEARYPVAALYLTAQAYLLASNHHKYSAGKRASEIIESGGSIEEARQVLENWLPESSTWD
jgi:hypothetical protein